jgi:hypothetical protein
VGQLADRIVDHRQLTIVHERPEDPGAHECDRTEDAADGQAPT